MSRPKKKPDFDHDKILDEILKNVVEAYENLETVQRPGGQIAYGALKELTDGLGLKPAKVKKLLMTANVRFDKEIYCNDNSREILRLYKEGKTITEIMGYTGLKRSAVLCYLPYTKAIYKADDLSTDAERIRLFRMRQKRCQDFMIDIAAMSDEEAEAYLWETLEYLQGCVFHTVGRGKKEGLRFRYMIKGGELYVNGKDNSITRATVKKAFANTCKLQEKMGYVSDPREIGTNGASYLYSIFLRLGICTQNIEGSVS